LGVELILVPFGLVARDVVVVAIAIAIAIAIQFMHSLRGSLLHTYIHTYIYIYISNTHTHAHTYCIDGDRVAQWFMSNDRWMDGWMDDTHGLGKYTCVRRLLTHGAHTHTHTHTAIVDG